ncbi:hypothetical protein MGN70_010632 [Eutypa lata]|nr:hypothetical protein MGN70_010632 [Eutypa lata]
MHITLLGSSTRCGKVIDFGCGMLNLLDDIVVSQLCRSRECIDSAAEVALLVPILCPGEEVDDMDVNVGTFDEAFKSRIPLALHYENLGPSQCRKIWRNCMNCVKSLDPTIDFERRDRPPHR